MDWWSCSDLLFWNVGLSKLEILVEVFICFVLMCWVDVWCFSDRCSGGWDELFVDLDCVDYLVASGDMLDVVHFGSSWNSVDVFLIFSHTLPSWFTGCITYGCFFVQGTSSAYPTWCQLFWWELQWSPGGRQYYASTVFFDVTAYATTAFNQGPFQAGAWWYFSWPSLE